MTTLLQRQELVTQIREAHTQGARLELACAEVGISIRTLERWVDGPDAEPRGDGRPTAIRPEPINKLSHAEREQVLQTCMTPRFADIPPTQIVPILADEGTYIASESSFYRILKANQCQHHRGRAQLRRPREPKRHLARRPRSVWCWDVTYLPSTVRGAFFYLFAVIDLYSRKLVGWEVHESEGGDQAAELIERTKWREGVRDGMVILHSDNGAAQRSFTLQAKLRELGIEPSYSRPGVSNDNPHIESWFRTAKYVPSYPHRGFTDIEHARQWVLRLVTWYNTEHRHREIGYVTPEQRHTGQSHMVLQARRALYERAKAAHPERWRRKIRSWSEPDHVWLSPPQKGAKAA